MDSNIERWYLIKEICEYRKIFQHREENNKISVCEGDRIFVEKAEWDTANGKY